MSHTYLDRKNIMLNTLDNAECITPDPAIGGGGDMSDGRFLIYILLF